MKSTFNHGFTLIELLMVILLSALLMVPIWEVFSAGSKTALRGILSVETTLEARRILKQIHNELKSSCLSMESGEVLHSFDDLLVTSGSVLNPSYSFCTFPLHGEILGDVILTTSTDGPAPRLLNNIRYWIEGERKSETPFGKLMRLEIFNPKSAQAAQFPQGKLSTLSDRVNYFEIKKVNADSKAGTGHYFWVHLRLVDVISPTVAEKLKVLSTDPIERSRGIVLADFYDMVSPDQYQALWYHRGIARNWYNQPTAK
ncbi:MAG: prepilin-type N-terminal cleavage/methylation domain-containing protein [Candidatus Ozemobacteraceae bacterium]